MTNRLKFLSALLATSPLLHSAEISWSPAADTTGSAFFARRQDIAADPAYKNLLEKI